jgi:hypothetical protein
MGFYSDVKPGESFRPSASLSNDVRHFLNRLNGFGGGVNPAAAPGIVRIPVYNSTSAVLSEGKAVSIDISGIIAGECYPAIAYSDTMPCYGVLAKDLNPAEVGDCILSGLAVVQISSTSATGNYATPGTGGVFVRGDEGVPIVNVSSTAAVVMLGAVKASGGGTGDHATNASYGIVKTDPEVVNQDDGVHPVPQDQVPQTQAVYEAIKEQYWKPKYSEGGSIGNNVNVKISNSYVNPTSQYLFHPTEDGLFYIEIYTFYNVSYGGYFMVDIYSQNPLQHQVGATTSHRIFQCSADSSGINSLYMPALKKHWYYFYGIINMDDEYIYSTYVRFFKTSK